MTDTELFSFMDVFNNLQRVFPKRLDEHEKKQLGASYFKVMRRFPLAQVTAGAETWMQRGKFFPKPAEWIDAIPRADKQQRAEVAELTAFEAAEYTAAERQYYEDDPCRCARCRAAGVDHRFLRFVPDYDQDGQEVRAKLGDRLVTRGHWAHGDELAGWYVAKEKFWALFKQTVQRRTVNALDTGYKLDADSQ